MKSSARLERRVDRLESATRYTISEERLKRIAAELGLPEDEVRKDAREVQEQLEALHRRHRGDLAAMSAELDRQLAAEFGLSLEEVERIEAETEREMREKGLW